MAETKAKAEARTCMCKKRHFVDQDETGNERWAEVGDSAIVEIVEENTHYPLAVGIDRNGASGFYSFAEADEYFAKAEGHRPLGDKEV